MPPICGTFFHANLAEVAVSAQVRPRTKLAGAKWIIAVEVYVKAEPCGEDRSFQRTHGTSFWESGCPQPHSPSTKEHLLWGLLPAFSPPFSACFLFLQVPQPLHAHSPPRCLPFPSLPLAHLGLKAFAQSRPNITSHLLIVTSVRFSVLLFLHSLRTWLCLTSP